MQGDARSRGDARVLLCIPTLGCGGAERQVRLLAPRLVDRGIHIGLFSRLDAEDLASMTAAGIACFPIVATGNRNPRLAAELARAARRTRAQVIHTWMPQMDILGGAIALATRRFWLLSERCSAGLYGGGARDRLRGWLGQFADVMVANSDSGLAVWPDHPRRMVISNGVDFEAIRDAPAAVAAAALGGRPIVVMVARLVKRKRIDAGLHALARIRRVVPEVLMAIVGAGPEEQALKALAAELGVIDNVHFAGFRPDAWSWIKSASVLLSASRFEGQPNTVLEAAAAGTPQVLSDIVMHRDVVGDDGAVFVDPDDKEALAAAIVSLLTDPERARTVAAAARAATLKLTIERATDLYAELYRRAASGRMLGAGSGPS